LNVKCPYCYALKFKDEPKGTCCGNGKIKLPPLNNLTELLLIYLSGSTNESKHFLDNIRKYNSNFNMNSFGTHRIKEPEYQTIFKIQGQVYHRIGSLLPYDGESSFLQIYFIGDDELQSQRRSAVISNVKADVILLFQTFLQKHNELIKLLKSTLEKMPTDECRMVLKADKIPANEHERCFNLPTIKEVAVVINGNEFVNRDILLQKRSNKYLRVQETDKSYDALQYPLMFWRGGDGYHFNLKQIVSVSGLNTNKKISAMDFYACRIMIRKNPKNYLLRYNQLFNQFIVDMYAKIKNQRLCYIRYNQSKLKVNQYIHLKDAFITDGNIENIGQKLILPARFIGSPRHMHEYTQDALCITQNNGKPCLFMMFTRNSQ